MVWAVATEDGKKTEGGVKYNRYLLEKTFYWKAADNINHLAQQPR